MSKLGLSIQKACLALGLQVELNFILSLENNRAIHSVARIPEIGCGFPNGMLVVNSLDDIRDYPNQTVAGYGISLIGELTNEDDCDIEAWQEVFIDWGWNGDPSSKPKWMMEPSLEELEKTLLNSSSVHKKEEAARKISLIHWENAQSQKILFNQIQSGKLSNGLRSCYIDSLASIWIRHGEINKHLYNELDDENLRQILAPWFKETAEIEGHDTE